MITVYHGGTQVVDRPVCLYGDLYIADEFIRECQDKI